MEHPAVSSTQFGDTNTNFTTTAPAMNTTVDETFTNTNLTTDVPVTNTLTNSTDETTTVSGETTTTITTSTSSSSSTKPSVPTKHNTTEGAVQSTTIRTRMTTVPSLTHYCPDLQDLISIDISITTSKDTNNESNHKVNLENGNQNGGGKTSAGNTPQMMAVHHRRSGNGLVLSTTDHKIGAIVRVSCETQQQNPVVLKCGPGGVWNATLPNCTDLDTSQYPLYFAVAGGAVSLILFVLFILYCHLLRTRKHGQTAKMERELSRRHDTDRNMYVDPYHIGEKLYHSPGSPHYARSEIAYAKPIVYSTYLNPAFYEDAYDRWRRQEQMVAEKLYDSPWLKPRGLQRQMDTPGFRWSQSSLKAIEDSGFKKLPRAQLSIDKASIRSNTSVGSIARTRDGRNGQSSSPVSCEIGMLRRYPSMAANDPRPGTLSAHGEVLTEDDESMTGYELKSTDGLTNF